MNRTSILLVLASCAIECLALSCGGATETSTEPGGAAGSGGSAGNGEGGEAGFDSAAGGTAGYGTAGSGAQVTCGQSHCSAPAEFCCAAYQPAGAGDCQPKSAYQQCTGSTGVAMFCDGPEDCDPGRVCCGINGSGLPFIGAIQCADTCSVGDWTHTQFCQPGAPNDCPNAAVCKPCPLLSTYFCCVSS